MSVELGVEMRGIKLDLLGEWNSTGTVQNIGRSPFPAATQVKILYRRLGIVEH